MKKTNGFSRIGAGGKRRYGNKGAGLFITDGDVVLLLKRKPPCDEPDTWGIPGGKLKDGEAEITGARREAREETGDLPDMTRIAEFSDQDHHHHFKTYLMRVDKQYNVTISNESSDYQWLPLARMRMTDLHPGLKRIWPAVARAIVKHFGNGTSHEDS